MSNKSKAWDIIGDKFWQLGAKRLKPTKETIKTYIHGIDKKNNCCVIGATSIGLINALLRKNINLTVFDFSKVMCDSLKSKTKGKIKIIYHDATKTFDKSFFNSFDIVIFDRLINRFSIEECKKFLNNIRRILNDSGEIRTTIKHGLYKLDHEIIESLENRPNELIKIFDSKHLTINYSMAAPTLKKLGLKNGRIKQKDLINWYVNRGKEQRFSDMLIKDILSKANYKISFSEKVNDGTNSIYYIIKKTKKLNGGF